MSADGNGSAPPEGGASALEELLDGIRRLRARVRQGADGLAPSAGPSIGGVIAGASTASVAEDAGAPGGGPPAGPGAAPRDAGRPGPDAPEARNEAVEPPPPAVPEGAERLARAPEAPSTATEAMAAAEAPAGPPPYAAFAPPAAPAPDTTGVAAAEPEGATPEVAPPAPEAPEGEPPAVDNLPASIEAGPRAGAEDEPLPLDLGLDTLPDDALIFISGLPEGANLTAGTRGEDGVWRLTLDEARDAALIPPADWSGALSLDVTARWTGAFGVPMERTSILDIHVEAVADAPLVAGADLTGLEDQAIALDLSAALSDLDGSETLEVAIAGVPDGATLSAGTRGADGLWRVAPGDLAGLTLTPPADFSGRIDLALRATSTERANGDAAVSEARFTVDVAGVADAPEIAAADAAGLEDREIALALSAALTDLDGSETLDVIIDGVPMGARLSAGALGADGLWRVAPGDLTGLTMTPPANFSGRIDLTLRATSSEGGNAAAAVSETAFSVVVAPDADAPALSAERVAGLEDQVIALDLSAALTDLDGSETVEVVIAGVPTGASLSAGTPGLAGLWRVAPGDLAGLALAPPADFSGRIDLTLRATSTEGANGAAAVSETTFSIDVAPAADAPFVAAANAAGREDQPVALALTAALTDLDGSETLEVFILGVPAGGALNHGGEVSPGVWSVAPGDVASLTFTPPANFSGRIDLTLRAVSTEAANGDSAASEVPFSVEVAAVADAPVVAAADVSGLEDQAIALDLSAALADLDGSETLSVLIAGVPDGASLSAGSRDADGFWRLAPGDLVGLTLTPPADFSGRIELTLRATSTEGANGDAAVSEAPFAIDVAGVADAPAVAAADVSGLEDEAIALDLSAALTDLDGSETLDVAILGVPLGATLSAGSLGADGLWHVAASELTGLTLTPPTDFSGRIDLILRATATESDNGDAAVTDMAFSVDVAAVADAPAVAASDAAGFEDQVIALDLSAALTDLDGSETLDVAIVGVPAGATLSAGTLGSDGLWHVAPGDLSGLTLSPPPNFSGRIELTLRATSTEGANGDAAVSETAFSVDVAAVADAPIVAAGNVSGLEDRAIALDLSAALTDLDGSETLGIVIAGVPNGATLNAGTRGSDGLWRVAPGDLSGLTLTPPANFSGRIGLTLRATATEGANGDAAVSEAAFAVTVAPVADAGSISGWTSGDEDTAIRIRPTFSTPDRDGSETWGAFTTVSGVPAGGRLNRGVETSPGVWQVATADLTAGLVRVTPPTNSDGDFSLTFATQLTDHGVDGATSVRDVTGSMFVAVNAVADAPVVTAADALGLEDQTIALDLSAALTDLDGSETLEVAIAGVPAGGSLSAGSRGSDGLWRLTPAELSGLVFTPPPDGSGDYSMRLFARSQERFGGSSIQAADFTVHVTGVADAPMLRVVRTVGNEDTSIPLKVVTEVVDTDGSESILGLRITDVPAGGKLAASGVELSPDADGNYFVPASGVSTLRFTPPQNFNGDVTLIVRSISVETDGDTAESAPQALSVHVTPVADAAIWDSASASGFEDAAIPLDLAARLEGPGATESLSYVISGVPDGARLTAGVFAGPGRWTLTADEAASVALIPPRDFAGRIELTATAITQEPGNGSTAESTVAFPVDVEAVVDARDFARTISGDEDTTIPLDLSIQLGSDQNETAVGPVTIAGLPVGAELRLADGTLLTPTGGAYTIARENLTGLTYTPPPDSDAPATFTVTQTVEDDGGVRAEVVGAITVDPRGVADAPELAIVDATGTSHSSSDPGVGWVPIDVGAALVDTDGSETLLVWLRGLPAGSILSAGRTNGSGSWVLTADDLDGLSIRPPSGFVGSIEISVSADAREAEGDVATTTGVLNVQIDAPVDGGGGGGGTGGDGGGGDPGTGGSGGGGDPGVADFDPPVVVVEPATGSEDASIPLSITASADPGLTIAIRVEGVPAGARLSAGVYDPETGDWLLNESELAGLTLTPPADFDGRIDLHVVATALDDVGRSSSAEADVPADIEAVADAASISVAPVAVIEDQAVPINLAVAAGDIDGSESVVSIVISGLPAGARLADAAGVHDNGDGTWTVDPAAAGDVALIPPPNAHGVFGFDIDVVTRETANGDERTTRQHVDVEVDARADAPVVHAGDVSGLEDRATALDLSGALTDLDGSEAISFTISGLPEGARLSAGVNAGDGVWTLRPADLAGLTVTPPGDWSGDMTLTFTAFSREGSNGDVASASTNFTLSVAGVADAPLIDAETFVAGSEDDSAPLNLIARLTDRDGSETLEVALIGLPDGFSLSAGGRDADGAWVVSGDDLAGLRLIPPENFSGGLDLTLRATSREVDGDSATTESGFAVTIDVAPAADAPFVAAANAAGREDQPVALALTAALTDLDGSETLEVFILGVPAGGALNHGGEVSPGVWSVAPGDVASLTFTPPANFSGRIDLTLRAVSTEAANGDSAASEVPFSVEVAAVADAPVVAAADVSGLEDQAIALDLSAALADLDGSETLSVLIAGVPDGASLSAGSRDADGFWRLAPGDLVGLTLTPPADFSGRIELTLRATSTEGANGDAAVSEAPFAIDVAGVADAPILGGDAVLDATTGEPKALGLSAVLADLDGSETLTLALHGVPDGATLSAGTLGGDGVWRLEPADLDGLTLTAPAGSSGSFDLRLEATATEADGDVATRSLDVRLDIVDANEAPELTLFAGETAAAGAASIDAVRSADIADDGGVLASARASLGGGFAGETLEIDGVEIGATPVAIGDTGVSAVRDGASGLLLTGEASSDVYADILSRISIATDDPSGLQAGSRQVSIEAFDTGGLSSGLEVASFEVSSKINIGNGADRIMMGTGEADVFIGSSGSETMNGGNGADTFIVGPGGGADVIDGGADSGGQGNWLDAIKLEGVEGPPGGDWTLQIDGAFTAREGANSIDFDAPVSGEITFVDGGTIEFTRIDRITW